MTPQNNKTEKSLLLGKDEQQSGSYKSPTIRTMADDLAAARGKGEPPKKSSFKKPAGASGDDKAPAAESKVPSPPRKSEVFRKSGKEGDKRVAIPQAQERAKVKSSPFKSVIIGVLAAVVLGTGIWTAWVLWPRKTDTVADVVPKEALAFVGLESRESSVTEKVLPKLTEAFDLTPAKLGDKWGKIAYVIVSGSSASEPVDFLLLEGEEINLSLEGNSDIAVKKLASGGTALVSEEQAGRLDGLSGEVLGETGEYQKLLNKLVEGDGYLYMRDDQFSNVLKPFSFGEVDKETSLLLSLKQEEMDNLLVTVFAAVGSEIQPGKTEANWENMLAAAPSESIALLGRESFAQDLDQWRIKESDNPSLQEFFRLFAKQGEEIKNIKDNIKSQYLAGTMAAYSDKPEKMDAFLVIPLREESQEEVKKNMRLLENSLRETGAYVGKSAFPEASFVETEYNGDQIRYVNFGAPEHAFDYAVKDSLLLVSTSRESIYLLLDSLRNGNTAGLDYKKLADNYSPGQWYFFNINEAVAEQNVSSWETLTSIFQSLYIRAITEHGAKGKAILR